MIAGGAARARKRARKAPTTRAALIRARASFCATQGRDCSLERGSFLDRRGASVTFRERILEKSIMPARRRGCTVYVTKASGERLPAHAVERPFTVWTLCQGGREVTGDNGHATLDAAMSKARRAAAVDVRRTHPASRRERVLR